MMRWGSQVIIDTSAAVAILRNNLQRMIYKDN